jgi:uncharacterized protein YdiU (UPF0061 family)
VDNSSQVNPREATRLLDFGDNTSLSKTLGLTLNAPDATPQTWSATTTDAVWAPKNDAPLNLTWTNGFAQLGEAFFTSQLGEPLPEVRWVAHSPDVAKILGFPHDWPERAGLLEALSGGKPLPGMQPLASVYSGHQFGVWAGQLGDGRALYLGELRTPGGSFEIQLKGAGPTPYSRRADGRAVLRSSIREFLCSEAMAGLGIPTTRALCLVDSPQPVRREEIETAAVLTRLAPSFVRFGHFEHFSSIGDLVSLKTLLEHVLAQPSLGIKQHLERVSLGATLETLSTKEQCLALLEVLTERYAQLMAQWQGVGFCHGVMNTDNMSILGLTLDYGPFQFMDGYNPMHICNHTDQEGRYAYARQPKVAYWNLFCLGQALMPLIADPDATVKALETFKTHLPLAMEHMYAKKLGLTPDVAFSRATPLAQAILEHMAPMQVDYSIFWRLLSVGVRDLPSQGEVAFRPTRDLFLDPSGFDDWLPNYLSALEREDLVHSAQGMLSNNPKFVLRNHLCEIAIRQAKMGDFSHIHNLLTVLRSPFDEHPEFSSLADHPPAWAQSIEISCSS